MLRITWMFCALLSGAGAWAQWQDVSDSISQKTRTPNTARRTPSEAPLAGMEA